MPKPTVLFAVLNWGLGHASRSIPIITALRAKGVKIVIASDGRAGLLLQSEFPDLPYAELSGYNVSYPTHNMVWNLGVQLPKITCAVFREEDETKRLVAEHQITHIISDQRYGCRMKGIPSAFITHQVRILAPNKLAGWVVNQIHHRRMRNFQEVWVPESLSPPFLAGQLAEAQIRQPLKRIGTLSRLAPAPPNGNWDVIALLSGPEPQRSRLEELITRQALAAIDYQVLIVRGVTETKGDNLLAPNIRVIDHLTQNALAAAISSTRTVIARSGYSTIMDLSRFGVKAVLIPTPGQTEQEYLARHLARQGIFAMQTQQSFELNSAIAAAQTSSGILLPQTSEGLDRVLTDFLR